MEIQVRPERPADFPSVRAVVAAAFHVEPAVADLVDLLRASPGYLPDLALVATEDDRVVGHVMLTRVPLHGAAADVLCLSPLAVRPDRQARGVGRALVERALRLADAGGWPLVVLEGDPALYRRFGFEPGSGHGLSRPSPTIPTPAYQVRRLRAYHPGLRGRVGYPAPFWGAGGSGLPEPTEADGPYRVAWLYQFARYAGWTEAVAGPDQLNRAVPACPGWTVGDVLAHLGTVHRLVAAWIGDGRRPRRPQCPPPGADPREWYSSGWRELYRVLTGLPHDAPAAGWSPWDDTAGFWRRRMVHEIAVHTRDVLDAVPGSGPAWTVLDEVALDGVDEALRLWLGTRLGGRAGGDGGVTRLSCGGQSWTVGVHDHNVEVHRLPTPPDAEVEGDPAALYAWLWGRAGEGGSDGVRIRGDRTVVAELRRALAVATA